MVRGAAGCNAGQGFGTDMDEEAVLSTGALPRLPELDSLRDRLAEVEGWADTPVRAVALRFLREHLSTLGREIRSLEFLEATRAYSAARADR
jgi:hypothetical protein